MSISNNQSKFKTGLMFAVSVLYLEYSPQLKMYKFTMLAQKVLGLKQKRTKSQEISGR